MDIVLTLGGFKGHPTSSAETAFAEMRCESLHQARKLGLQYLRLRTHALIDIALTEPDPHDPESELVKEQTCYWKPLNSLIEPPDYVFQMPLWLNVLSSQIYNGCFTKDYEPTEEGLAAFLDELGSEAPYPYWRIIPEPQF